jgi:hypothetical protein
MARPKLSAEQIIQEGIVYMGACQVAPTKSLAGEYKRNRIVARLTSVGVHNDHLLFALPVIGVHKTLRLILLL